MFKGDLYFYRVDGDLREKVKGIDTTACPLYLLTGEYDLSATPALTAELARLVKAEPKEWTFAQTFPTGTHAMWLYYWMAANGINPMTDAKVITCYLRGASRLPLSPIGPSGNRRTACAAWSGTGARRRAA